MKTVKVSVIVPVYNSEKYLQNCLDTILNQSLKEIEVICVDDGSIDQSRQILERNAKKDDRIRIVSKGHSNAGEARNEGMKIARGEFLSFLDADDYFDLKMLEKAYIAANSDSEIDIVIYGANEDDIARKRIRRIDGCMRIYNCPKHNPFQPEEMSDFLFNSFQNCVWNKLFRKDFIDKEKICFQSVQRTNDMLFACRALTAARKLYVIDEELAYYRIGQTSNLQSTNYLDPDSFWLAYTTTYRELKRTLGSGFDKYEKSFLNCVLSGIKYNLSRIERDRKAWKYAKSLIVLKSEEYFNFLKLSKEEYYNKELYDWYTSLLNQEDETERNKNQTDTAEYRIGSIITFIPKKVFGLFKSLKDNGLYYTFRRILFHIHIIEDNDIEQTKRSGRR